MKKRVNVAAAVFIGMVVSASVGRVFAQNAVSTGTKAGFRMYYPGANDWWLDPSQGRFDIRMNGSSPTATLSAHGDLGIGTTSPAGKLDVYGSICLSGGNCITSWPSGASSFAPNRIGLKVLNNAASLGTKIDVAFLKLGVENLMISSSAVTTYTADSGVNGANGLDTGTRAANTWYSIWMIASADGSSVAGLLSTANEVTTSPVLPGGYAKKRRVGWVRTDGAGNFRQFFTANGRTRYMDDVRTFYQADVNNPPHSDTWFDVDLSAAVPPSSYFCVLGVSYDVGGNGYNEGIGLRPKGSAYAASYAAGTFPHHYTVSAATNSVSTMVYADTSLSMGTDQNQFIQYRVGFAGNPGHFRLSVLEYVDDN